MMQLVWELIYESENLTVRKFKQFISLIRTDCDEDTEVIINEADLEQIYEAYWESEE